jgi:nucleoside-diphosphate-sugar epimerase
MSTVLVTGGSGFIASHCILQLLAAGHQVRTTVRNLKRESEVRTRKRLCYSGKPAAAWIAEEQPEAR